MKRLIATCLISISALVHSIFAGTETIVLQNRQNGYFGATDRACVDDYGAYGSGQKKTNWWLSEDISWGTDYSSPSSGYFSIGYFEC